MEDSAGPGEVGGDAPAPASGRARLSLLLGPLLAALVWCLPLDLPEPAHRLAAVMTLVVVFWIGEPIPVAVTALLGPTLALLLGAVPAGDAKAQVASAYAKFGDPILMLFVGGFFIAEAMTVHGLDRRVAMRILSWRAFSATPARMVAGLALCSCLLSMWMSNTAVTALMIPIATGMLAVAGGGARLAAPTLLTLSFAATVGGLGTPVGTAPNLIGLAQIETLTGVRIGFLPWMLMALPLVALMLGAVVLLMTRGLPPSTADLRAHALAARKALGPWTRGQAVTASAFGLAVLLWMGTGLTQIWRGGPAQTWCEAHLPEGAVALLAASLLFIIPAAPGRPTLTWKEAARIDWGTLLLLGGGLSMGDLMLKTGLASSLGSGVAQGLGISSLWGLTALAAGLAIGISELTSNTATASMLVPVVIGIAKAAGVSPVPPALAATLGCSFGFMLPISTPPNALAYGTGRVSLGTMARRGLVFDVIGFVVLVAGLRLLCPALGLV